MLAEPLKNKILLSDPITTGATTSSPTKYVQRRDPVVQLRAYTRPPAEPKMTSPLDETAQDVKLEESEVEKFHAKAPDETSRATKTPVVDPKQNNVSLHRQPVAEIESASNDQARFPVAAETDLTMPSLCPKITEFEACENTGVAKTLLLVPKSTLKRLLSC